MPKDDVIPLGEYCVTFAMKAFCQIAFGDFFDSKQCKKMLHSYEMVGTARNVENICRTRQPNYYDIMLYILSTDMDGWVDGWMDGWTE